MTTERPDSTTPELSASALNEWTGYVEGVLRGIAHALNNRAAALSAVIELIRDPEDREDPAVVGSILGTELERVGSLVAAVRSIAAPRGGADAFTPSDAATEAAAVLSLHVEQREHHVVIDAAGAPPLRVQRWMYVRALIALAANATRIDSAATVRVTGDGEWLVTQLNKAVSPLTPVTPYVSELAQAMGGSALAREEGYGFRVPTLAALRRREGREG